MSENILEINNLSKYFGGLAAVSDCSLKVKKGTITGIIGPNGSGKTTLFNLIAGNLKSSAGSVMFNDENITDVPSYELFSKGLLRTFQIAHEFTNLSVLENLMMVPGNQSGEKLMNALLKPSLVAKEENQIKEKAMEVVDFPAPLGPRIETISPFSTLTEHELIISGPLPYPPVMLFPSKNAIVNYPLVLNLCLNNFQLLFHLSLHPQLILQKELIPQPLRLLDHIIFL